MTERVLATAVHDNAEEELERSLRPQSLGDFVGQERVKEQLGIALDAAHVDDETGGRASGDGAAEPCDHRPLRPRVIP